MRFGQFSRNCRIHAADCTQHSLIHRILLKIFFALTLAGLPFQYALLAQGQNAAFSEVSSDQGAPSSAYRYTLPLSLALEAATEAVRVCAQNGYQVSATVVDMDGVPQVAIRGDGATIHTAESSFDKAYTVVTLGPIFKFETSGQFFDLTKISPFAPRLATMHNVMALPGGVALKSKNAIMAALGVGGAPGGDKDEVCARAGVTKIADRLPK